MNQSLKEELGL